MTPLVRPEFHPKLWSADDLDATASHWLWLFGQAPATAGRDADHRTELRLRGVPNAQRDATAEALAARAPDAEVTRPDADTLVAVASSLDFVTSPAAGLGVPALAGPPFDGLYLEVRFTAAALERNGTPHAAGTLVFAGELGPEGFTVYAVWGEGDPILVNQQPAAVAWADEQVWQSELESYRAGAAATATTKALAQRAFPKSRSNRHHNASVWLVSFPFTGERRPARLLTRVAVDLAVVAVVAGYVWIVPTPDDFIVAWKLSLLFVFASPLYYLLVQLAKSWRLTRRYMVGVYAVLYSGSERLLPADANLAASYFSDPSGRKIAADWEAAGCRTLGNAKLENPLLQNADYRLLCSADGTDAVVLIAIKFAPNPEGTPRSHYWPALVVAMVVTRFADGSAAATVNGPGSLFRRKLYGPEFVARVHPGLTDPAQLLAKHAELCQGHAEHAGQAAMPATSFDEFARWNFEHGEEERRLYAHNPVTWSDAFVLLMGYVRRAYR